jgi:hypothetical protein
MSGQIFGEHSHDTTSNTSSEGPFHDYDFFSDVNNIFSDLSDKTNDNVNGSAPAAVPYVFLSSMLDMMLKFLVLAFGLDVICLFHLDVICSSICPVCTTSLIHVL